ncbi:MAG: alpha-1,2-fucosyltransferase [Candidatus Pacearchaeota archaeon]
MIVIKLTGGLGNQLFQYAFGKYYSIKNKTSLGINEDSYKNNKRDSINRRVNHLHDFKTNFEIVKTEKLKEYLFITGNKFLDDYILLKIKRIHKKAFFEGDRLLKLKNKRDICIIGYFIYGESERLEKIKKILVEEIDLKEKSKYLKRMIKEINKKNSVSIHVRRGDVAIMKEGYLLPLKYYKKAVRIIESKIKEPEYYIFSDDINWCKRNFHFINGKFIHMKNVSEDFELMKRCKNNIIANSTLSWWAAYLNKNKRKVIIQPENMGHCKEDKKKALIFKKAYIIKEREYLF